MSLNNLSKILLLYLFIINQVSGFGRKSKKLKSNRNNILAPYFTSLIGKITGNEKDKPEQTTKAELTMVEKFWNAIEHMGSTEPSEKGRQFTSLIGKITGNEKDKPEQTTKAELTMVEKFWKAIEHMGSTEPSEKGGQSGSNEELDKGGGEVRSIEMSEKWGKERFRSTTSASGSVDDKSKNEEDENWFQKWTQKLHYATPKYDDDYKNPTVDNSNEESKEKSSQKGKGKSEEEEESNEEPPRKAKGKSEEEESDEEPPRKGKGKSEKGGSYEEPPKRGKGKVEKEESDQEASKEESEEEEHEVIIRKPVVVKKPYILYKRVKLAFCRTIRRIFKDTRGARFFLLIPVIMREFLALYSEVIILLNRKPYRRNIISCFLKIYFKTKYPIFLYCWKEYRRMWYKVYVVWPTTWWDPANFLAMLWDFLIMCYEGLLMSQKNRDIIIAYIESPKEYLICLEDPKFHITVSEDVYEYSAENTTFLPHLFYKATHNNEIKKTLYV